MTGPRHADRPSHVARFMSASASEGSPLNPDTLEVAPGTIHETVQGWVPKLATEEELRMALEKYPNLVGIGIDEFENSRHDEDHRPE